MKPRALPEGPKAKPEDQSTPPSTPKRARRALTRGWDPVSSGGLGSSLAGPLEIRYGWRRQSGRKDAD